MKSKQELKDYLSNYQKTERGKKVIKKANDKYVMNNINQVIYQRLKHRSLQKKMDFNLTPEYIKSILVVSCPILNIPIKVNLNNKGSRVRRDSISIDRIDNTKGYIIGNVRVVSSLANRMKSDATPQEMITFAKWVLNTYNEDTTLK